MMMVVVVEEGEKEEGAYERVARMATGNPVVVFSTSECCMCHVVKSLLLGLGVGPTVYELDRLPQYSSSRASEIEAVLSRLLLLSDHNDNNINDGNGNISMSSSSSSSSGVVVLPVVFVGGKLVGGVEKLMACHINGSLVPLLKQAGALWL